MSKKIVISTCFVTLQFVIKLVAPLPMRTEFPAFLQTEQDRVTNIMNSVKQETDNLEVGHIADVTENPINPHDYGILRLVRQNKTSNFSDDKSVSAQSPSGNLAKQQEQPMDLEISTKSNSKVMKKVSDVESSTSSYVEEDVVLGNVVLTSDGRTTLRMFTGESSGVQSSRLPRSLRLLLFPSPTGVTPSESNYETSSTDFLIATATVSPNPLSVSESALSNFLESSDEAISTNLSEASGTIPSNSTGVPEVILPDFKTSSKSIVSHLFTFSTPFLSSNSPGLSFTISSERLQACIYGALNLREQAKTVYNKKYEKVLKVPINYTATLADKLEQYPKIPEFLVDEVQICRNKSVVYLYLIKVKEVMDEYRERMERLPEDRDLNNIISKYRSLRKLIRQLVDPDSTSKGDWSRKYGATWNDIVYTLASVNRLTDQMEKVLSSVKANLKYLQ